MDWNELSREVARETGCDPDGGFSQDGQHPWVVAAIRIATLREREACAVIAATPISGEQDDITMAAKDRVAAAIRKRSNVEVTGAARLHRAASSDRRERGRPPC